MIAHNQAILFEVTPRSHVDAGDLPFENTSPAWRPVVRMDLARSPGFGRLDPLKISAHLMSDGGSGAQEPPVVEPIDPFQSSELDGLE